MKSMLLAACLACVPVAGWARPAQTPATAASDPAAQAAAKQQIGAVIEAFRTAIIEKDKPGFLGLFLEGGRIAWQDVIGDANLHQLRLKNPKASKARVDPDDSPLSFIDGIVADQARSEESFDNVRIDTDGDIASVVFDYRFLSDGRETNRGSEAWHLLRTDAGWKIVSVIWSTRWGP